MSETDDLNSPPARSPCQPCAAPSPPRRHRRQYQPTPIAAGDPPPKEPVATRPEGQTARRRQWHARSSVPQAAAWWQSPHQRAHAPRPAVRHWPSMPSADIPLRSRSLGVLFADEMEAVGDEALDLGAVVVEMGEEAVDRCLEVGIGGEVRVPQ